MMGGRERRKREKGKREVGRETGRNEGRREEGREGRMGRKERVVDQKEKVVSFYENSKLHVLHAFM